MGKLSNEAKKQLFLRLIEECDKGNTYRSNDIGNVFHDAGYYDYGDGWKIKNNGILGLWYYGIDEEGKRKVGLSVGGSLEERDNTLFGSRDTFAKSFSDSELDQFLDRFFNMNNMEVLNEFGDTRYFKENENYRTPYSNISLNSLEYLNMIDYFNALSEGFDLQNAGGPRLNMGEDFFADAIQVTHGEEDEYWILSETYGKDGKQIAHVTLRQNADTLQYKPNEQYGDNKEIERILAVVNKAISDVPEIYKRLGTGTYKKEDFVPTRDFIQKASLQQIEEELSKPEEKESEKGENKYKKYRTWITAIREQCTRENYRDGQLSADGTRYSHYQLKNGLHVYKTDDEMYIFESEWLGQTNTERDVNTERSLYLGDASDEEYNYYNFSVEFTFNRHTYEHSNGELSGWIEYQDDEPKLAAAFLPDKLGQEQFPPNQYPLVLSKDIEEQLKDAMKGTDDADLIDSYQRALDFYNKIQDIVKMQTKETEEQNKNGSALMPETAVQNALRSGATKEDIARVENAENERQEPEEAEHSEQE